METGGRGACARNEASLTGRDTVPHITSGWGCSLSYHVSGRGLLTRSWLNRLSVDTDAARVAVSHCDTVTTPGSCSSVALAGRASEAWLCPLPPAGGAVSSRSRPRPRSCHAAGDAPSIRPSLPAQSVLLSGVPGMRAAK